MWWDSSPEAQVTLTTSFMCPEALSKKPLFLYPLLVFVFRVPTLDLLIFKSVILGCREAEMLSCQLKSAEGLLQES